MCVWMLLTGCISANEIIQSHSEVDFIYSTVALTHLPYPTGWSIHMDITVEAPADVEVTIPTHSPTLGSFNVMSLGVGGGGASDGSSLTTKTYMLEPTGLIWQTIPAIPISYIDKRTDPAGIRRVFYTEKMFFVYNPLF